MKNPRAEGSAGRTRTRYGDAAATPPKQRHGGPRHSRHFASPSPIQTVTVGPGIEPGHADGSNVDRDRSRAGPPVGTFTPPRRSRKHRSNHRPERQTGGRHTARRVATRENEAKERGGRGSDPLRTPVGSWDSVQPHHKPDAASCCHLRDPPCYRFCDWALDHLLSACFYARTEGIGRASGFSPPPRRRYLLWRMCRMSPSTTTYSRPSVRCQPFSRAFASVPASRKRS